MSDDCPKCSVELEDGYIQCPVCLDVIPDDSVVCPRCHTYLVEEEPTEYISNKYLIILSLLLALGIVYLEGKSYLSLRFYIELIVAMIILFNVLNWFINKKI